jgi:hypothetical protein
MYKINVVQLWAMVPRATRVVLFSVPNRRLWLDVFVLLYMCMRRADAFLHARPSVPLFQIHYRPMVTMQLRANFLSLALSHCWQNNNKITSVSRLTPLNNSDGSVSAPLINHFAGRQICLYPRSPIPMARRTPRISVMNFLIKRLSIHFYARARHTARH